MPLEADDRDLLRAWIAERIPEGGDENATNFLNAELDALYDRTGSLEAAAAEAWRLKAGYLLEGTLVEEKQAGSEKIKFLSVEKRHRIYLANAAYYDELAFAALPTDPLAGSQVAEMDPPDVLHLEDQRSADDISRLIGY